MTLIAGVDPGTSGAFAIYDTETRRITSIHDIPTWYMSVGKKRRARVDCLGLMELFELLGLLGVELLVLEAVGGRPRQSASSGFVFGYTVGLIYMASMYSKIMVETVPPQRWKKVMNIPGKKNQGSKDDKKKADGDIMNRVSELFPHDRELFRGKQDGFKMDRADAAMLAKFGGDHVWHTMGGLPKDAEFPLAYRNAETGA